MEKIFKGIYNILVVVGSIVGLIFLFPFFIVIYLCPFIGYFTLHDNIFTNSLGNYAYPKGWSRSAIKGLAFTGFIIHSIVSVGFCYILIMLTK